VDAASLHARRYQRARAALYATAAIALFAGAGRLAWANASGRAPQPPASPVAVASAETTIPVFVPRRDIKVKPVAIPTPVFATYRSLAIHLPVKPEQVTLIAFHQAGSNRVTIHMRSLVPVVTPLAAKAAAKKEEPTESADEVAEAEDEPIATVWGGKVTRLWRSTRQGEADTAADCGSKPGTPVMAPVSGRVVAVHMYALYGQYPDYEIHIIPTGWDRMDCMVLHTTNPLVHAGDEVVGGVTKIAKVRELSKWFASQLDDYTHDGGNHVHIQFDQLPASERIQLMSTNEQVDARN
jgi:hypothetical protein